MKKAQLMAQPFYYIFVIIVIALILYFGFNIITNIIETQEKAKWIQFKTDFQTAVENVYTKNPGTRIANDLLIPKDATEVCFKLFQDYTKVSSDSEYGNSFNIDNLIHEQEDPYCIKTISQKLTFILENKILNDKTKVVIS